MRRGNRRVLRSGCDGGYALALFARGRDVEVHAEEVRRVVLGLQRGEPVVVDSVARSDELLLFFSEAGEVQVDAAGRVPAHRSPELSAPGDRLVALRGVGPADFSG